MSLLYHCVRLFNYVRRNEKKAKQPPHFFHFVKLFKEINVPHSRIANQSMLSHMNVPKLSGNAIKSENSEGEGVFRRAVKQDLKNW